MTWTGSAEDRKAWAIKKRLENAGKSRRAQAAVPVAPDRPPVDGYKIHPDNHACTPWGIDYTDRGATCETCGREWRLQTVSTAADGSPVRRWSVIPLTRRLP